MMNITVEYIKDGLNKVEVFSDIDDFKIIEKFVKDNNLTPAEEPENEGEYRLTD